MQSGLVKVTIVGYYTISDEELDNYGVEEFDLPKMIQVDRDEYAKYQDARTLIDFFRDSTPDVVRFELVE